MKNLLFLISIVMSIIIAVKNFNDYTFHDCIRDCDVYRTPKVCIYNFTIELSSVLNRNCFNCTHMPEDCFIPRCVTASGFKRPIMTVNRMLPGPYIQVCRDDLIVVNVENKLHSFQSTTIHWHGIKQRESPHMDGVGMITQCPITPHTNFEYVFKATDPGTHFWHAHSSGHRADGVFGALVVRDLNDHGRKYYDYDLKEHVIVLNDWSDESIMSKFNAFLHDRGDERVNAILINGKGADKHPLLRERLPKSVFEVERGLRYRFRVINAGVFFCPLEFSIQNHNITIIATDGNPTRPVRVSSFFILAGERFDFVLDANQNINAYWIKVKGHGDCQENEIFQTAILKYVRSERDIPAWFINHHNAGPDIKGKTLNPFNTRITYENENDYVGIDQVRSAPYDPDEKAYLEQLKTKPSRRFFLSLSMNSVNNPLVYEGTTYQSESDEDKWTSPQINNITFRLPSSPLIYQKQKIPNEMFCNQTNIDPGCLEDGQAFCSCIHTLEVNLNEVVEVILVDGGSRQENHPIHLHGNTFAVLGSEKIGQKVTIDEIKLMHIRGQLRRNLEIPPLKDTVTVPSGGYTIFRFVARNPGFWYMHCHIDFHSETGMSLLFKVGGEKDLPKLDKEDEWPQCGHYVTYHAASESKFSIIKDFIWPKVNILKDFFI